MLVFPFPSPFCCCSMVFLGLSQRWLSASDQVIGVRKIDGFLLVAGHRMLRPLIRGGRFWSVSLRAWISRKKSSPTRSPLSLSFYLWGLIAFSRWMSFQSVGFFLSSYYLYFLCFMVWIIYAKLYCLLPKINSAAIICHCNFNEGLLSLFRGGFSDSGGAYRKGMSSWVNVFKERFISSRGKNCSVLILAQHKADLSFRSLEKQGAEGKKQCGF